MSIKETMSTVLRNNKNVSGWGLQMLQTRPHNVDKEFQQTIVKCIFILNSFSDATKQDLHWMAVVILLTRTSQR